jgi:antitoxin component YwqK of YwqJK toxin-antitoxin module
MKNSGYKKSIPTQAVEVIEKYHANGAKETTCYVVGAEVVGYRRWDEEGHLDSEYSMCNGNKHGPTYFFFENGQLLSTERQFTCVRSCESLNLPRRSDRMTT